MKAVKTGLEEMRTLIAALLLSVAAPPIAQGEEVSSYAMNCRVEFINPFFDIVLLFCDEGLYGGSLAGRNGAYVGIMLCRRIDTSKCPKVFAVELPVMPDRPLAVGDIVGCILRKDLQCLPPTAH